MAGSNNGNSNESTGNNVINGVVIKATEIISDNKSGDWRKTLSGALDEQRLVFALAVITIYYIGYTIGSAYHDNHAKDEDIITRNCTCKPTHRDFYLSWSIICYILWGICHLLVLIFSSQHCNFKNCCSLFSCGNNNNKNTQPPNNQIRTTAGSNNESPSNNESSSNDQWTLCNQFCMSFCRLCSKIKSCAVDDDEIHRYEYYLWTQYYELYAIGVTQEIKIFNSKTVKKIFGDHLNINKITSTTEIDSPQGLNTDTSNKQTSPPDVVALAMMYHLRECKDYCSYCAHCVFHVILQVFRFCAQLATVPLLMIQMLDTYAFLCLTKDNYCTRRAQYNLHLDQTAITFGFYCSLLLSYLTTIMLRWIPWPDCKKEK